MVVGAKVCDLMEDLFGGLYVVCMWEFSPKLLPGNQYVRGLKPTAGM